MECLNTMNAIVETIFHVLHRSRILPMELDRGETSLLGARRSYRSRLLLPCPPPPSPCSLLPRLASRAGASGVSPAAGLLGRLGVTRAAILPLSSPFFHDYAAVCFLAGQWLRRAVEPGVDGLHQQLRPPARHEYTATSLSNVGMAYNSDAPQQVQ